MPSINDKIKKLPIKIQDYLLAAKGVQTNLEICHKFGFKIMKISDATDIMTRVFLKELKPSDLVAEIKQKLKLGDKKAKEFALELAGKRLLIIDDYLNGEIKKLIFDLGKDPKDYQDFIKDYIKITKEEIKKQKELDKKEVYIPPQPKMVAELAGGGSLDFKTPEEAVDQVKKVVKNHLLTLLTTETVELKVTMNAMMIDLFLEDAKYQKDVLSSLITNQEMITSEKIVFKNEKMEPTIANWIKDLVIHIDLREGEILSTVQKAKYYEESPNLKKLQREDRILLDKLFDFYENLLNFYQNVQRIELRELQLIPLTQDELDYLQKEFGEKPVEEAVTAQKEKDIYDIYRGDEKEQAEIEEIEDQIVAETRKEVNKVADVFYDYILKRKKQEIIACLKILVDIGSLDNVIATDKKYQELLRSYFKRNNMQTELADFQENPRQIKFVKHFIKYLLLERLAMSASDAGRVAAQLSNVFRSQGIKELSQMAFYDMERKEFVWL